MFLSMLAAALSGVAYVIYFFQVYNGGSVPNPASWSVWVLLANLNAVTFLKGSKDRLATTQFFVGSIGCVAVWIYALVAGRFSPLDTMALLVLVSCVASCVVWKLKGARYANVVIALIFLWSSEPTIQGAWQNGNVERALPWYLWTSAFAVSFVNVIVRRDRDDTRWWLLLAVPVVGIVIHGLVAVAAR